VDVVRRQEKQKFRFKFVYLYIMANNISLQKLIESGAHYGHQAKRWNPKMEPFIYGTTDGVHVFDLVKTKEALEKALVRLTEISKKKGKILLLGTKKQAKEKTKKVAIEAGVNYVTERWLGGTFTNFQQIKNSTRKLVEMKQNVSNGFYKDRTKKERLLIDREIARLNRFFGGLVGLDDLPDILVIVDTKREKAAVKEAKMKLVETIGIVDTNSDPELVDYPIPMNDDATKALEYVLELIGKAIEKGKGKKSTRTSKLKTSIKASKSKTISPAKS
jgi:small subunit ribosomal protein S2